MIVYRAATSEDVDALAAFAARTFVETFGHLYPPEDLQSYLASAYARERVAEEIADPEVHYALAMRGEDIAGYAMWGPVELKAECSENARELYRLYVDADVKGAGVGRRLMDDLIAAVRSEGGDEVWLSVWENNERAQSFYRRYGFEHIGEHKFMVGRVADRDLIWKLSL